jgi:hypothetical protein
MPTSKWYIVTPCVGANWWTKPIDEHLDDLWIGHFAEWSTSRLPLALSNLTVRPVASWRHVLGDGPALGFKGRYRRTRLTSPWRLRDSLHGIGRDSCSDS